MKAKNLFLFLFATILSLVCFTPKVNASTEFQVDNLHYNFHRQGNIFGVKVIESKDYAELTEINIPSTVTHPENEKTYKVINIDQYAFSHAKNLEKITIPKTVTSIGKDAFENTAYYNNPENWEDGVLYINDFLIAIKDDISSLQVKNGTRVLAESCCAQQKNLTNVHLPNTVENLSYMGFIGCANLKEITLPTNEKCTEIAQNMFTGCLSLKSIIIPKNISRIGIYSFSGCTSLTDIYCKGETYHIVSSFKNVDISQVNVHFPAQYTTFYEQEWKGFNLVPDPFCLDGIYYNLNDEKKTGMVTKEKNGIGNYASLPELVTIPKTVKDADDNKFKVVGIDEAALAFAPIKELVVEAEIIEIPEAALTWADQLTKVTLPASVLRINKDAFNNCAMLEHIPGLTDGNTDLLPNLTNIGDYAFIDCVKLQSLWLTSVTSIGKEAFSGCTELTDVNIGAQVKEIEEKAFNHCTKLKKITDFADKPQAFPNGLFNGIDKAQLVIYVHRTSYEAFKAADGWKDYNIQIISEELPRFTVYLEVNNEKAGTVSGGGTYVEGTEVTVTATPKEGYHFVRWSDGETKASYSFKLTKDVSLQAIFEENEVIYYYDLKLQSNDENLGTVSGGGTHIGKGTKVTITATPAEGCEFLYWVDANGAYWGKQTEWTVTKDETLTAHFRVIPDYDEYMVFVLGERVTSANAGDILGDGVWSYDRATHTLYTLKDAEYSKQNVEFIQDWETSLGALTVVVNHHITAEVETTDEVIRMALYGNNGIKFVGSKFTSINLTALNMIAAHTFKTLEVSNHLRLFITQGNTTEFGKSQFSTSMIFSGTPAIRVNSASVRLSVNLGNKISNQTNDKIELTNAEINYGELNGQYLEILDQTPMYMVNYETEEAMNKCNVSGMGSYYPGEQVTLRAQPETSYAFLNWSDFAIDNPYTFTMPAHDVLIDPVVIEEEFILNGAIVYAYGQWLRGYVVNENDESVYNGEWFLDGTVIILKAVGKNGFVFAKWSDGNTDNPRSITIEAGKHIDLQAEFEYNTYYTVTFLDWDDEVLKEENVYTGEDATAPDQPYRKGYTFTGWDKDYTNVTADLTVKAQFDINVYTVRFFDGTGEQLGEDQHIEYGKAPVAPEAPKVEGYVFVGWDQFLDFVESDLDVYAIYEIQRFKAEFTAGEHGTLVADFSDLDAVPYGETVTLVTIPEEHYEIDTWSDGGTGDTREIIVTGDTTVSVTFVKKQYEVTFIGFGGAVIDVVKVTAGEAATAPDLPLVTGYHFVEWDTPFNEIWENTTVTAIYEEDPVNMPENLQVKLTEIEGDTQLDFTWDPLEGAVSYAVGFGYGDEQSAMIPTPTNSLTLLLSKFVKDYSVKPGTYTVRWFVAGMDANSQPMSGWAEGEAFQITVKDTGTGIDEANSQELRDKSQKLLRNGHLFILVGEKTYDATGRKVQ